MKNYLIIALDKLLFFSATECHWYLIFQTMKNVRLNTLSLKYRRFTPLGCKDIGGVSNIWICGKNSIPLLKKIEN